MMALRDSRLCRTEPIPGSGRTAFIRFTAFTERAYRHDHGQLCVHDRRDRGQLMCDTASLSYFTDYASARDAEAPRSTNSSDKDLQRAEGSCRIVLGAPKEHSHHGCLPTISDSRSLPENSRTQVQEQFL